MARSDQSGRTEQVLVPGGVSVTSALSAAGSFSPARVPGKEPPDNGCQVKLSRIDGLTPKGLLDRAFYFQCPPTEEIRWAKGFSHAEYETLSGRTFSRPQSIGLKTVTFSTLVIDWDAEWTFFSVKDLIDVGEQLEHLGDSRQPFMLSIRNRPLWGAKFDVRMPATLRSVSVAERAGELDTRYVDCEFTEYKRPAYGVAGRRGKSGQKRRHTLRSGDTLRKLAKSELGSYVEWKAIANANGIKGLNGDSDLYAWGKRHHRSSIVIPYPDDRITATGEVSNTSVLNTVQGAG
jgi:hypothetical protein